MRKRWRGWLGWWQKLAPVGNAPVEGVNGAKGVGGGPVAAAPSTENCFSFVFIVWRSSGAGLGREELAIKNVVQGRRPWGGGGLP